MINILHENNFVFGNLEPSNILYDKNIRKTYLINFDWAGRDEIDHYPFFLNSKIDGDIMKKDHDLYQLENLFAK